MALRRQALIAQVGVLEEGLPFLLPEDLFPFKLERVVTLLPLSNFAALFRSTKSVRQTTRLLFLLEGEMPINLPLGKSEGAARTFPLRGTSYVIFDPRTHALCLTLSF